MATSFRIILNNHGITYTAGDVVSGQVVLSSTEDLTVKTVQIYFIGRSKTNLPTKESDGQRMHRGDIKFFHYQRLLYSGKYTLKANVYSWPFDFTFPSHADPNLGDRVFDKFPPFLGFGVAYSLPPTFDCYYGDNKGKIEYKLEASSVLDGSFSHSKLEHICPLRYMPLRTETITDTTPSHRIDASYTANTLRLLPDKQELKFRDKMHKFFKSTTLPSATFALRTTCPRVTYLNRRLPVTIVVVSLKCSDEVTTEPDIYITGLTIKIDSTYMFRTGRGLRPSTSGSAERVHTLLHNNDMRVRVPYSNATERTSPSRDEKSLLDSGADTVAASSSASSTIAEQLDLGSLTTHGWFQTPDLQPTFKTPNIAVSHRLKIKMKLDCASRHFGFEHEKDLIVLPPTARANASNDAIRQHIGA
jgi:hypothetical protein